MAKIKIDASLQQVLAGITEASHFVDDNGNILGVFTPKCQTDAEVIAMAQKVFDPVELDRRYREEKGEGIPYAEVKKRLQALEDKG